MNIHILDATLRDGSYAIDFQFSVEDTILLCTLLDEAGIPLIEIGHGLGFNAGPAGKGDPAASDEEYLAAAASSIRHGKFGMFCIPGIARLSDLELGRKYGMHFVRIGTNVTEIEQAEPFIRRAKDLGYELVFSNLMKSYAVVPEVFGECSRKASFWGADVVCLVDSAGGLLPTDVRKYLCAARGVSSVALGFHGHDNLTMGLANALSAIDSGAEYIDSSLQGLGRSAGNVMTETLVAVLKKLGHTVDVREKLLQNIGEQVIRPMLHSRGRDPLAITSGYAMFHSAFTGVVQKYSDLYGIDRRDLIVSLCERDKVNASPELVETIARELAGTRRNKEIRLPTMVNAISAGEPLHMAARGLARRIRAQAVKGGCRSVFNIEIPVQEGGTTKLSDFIQESFGFVIGSSRIASGEDMKVILEQIDGMVDSIFIDVESKSLDGRVLSEMAERILNKSRLYRYHDSEIWARSLRNQLLAIFGEMTGKRVGLFGDTAVAFQLAQMLAIMGVEVAVSGWSTPPFEALEKLYPKAMFRSTPELACSNSVAIIGTTPGSFEITPRLAESFPRGAIVIDGGIGSLAPSVVEECFKKGCRVLRVDMRATLAGEIASRLGTEKVVCVDAGRTQFDGVYVVAGGELGRRGEIVVDSLNRPERVIGVADGGGNVLYQVPEEFTDAVSRVWRFILQKRMAE